MPMSRALPAPLPPGFYDAYVCLRDVKSPGTPGGTFTSGAWRTRDLNQELADTAAICTLAANQITLPAGDYRCFISAPAREVDYNQLRLYNITDAAELLRSMTFWHTTAHLTIYPAILHGPFTLAATKVLEVQHYCGTTKATFGFGWDLGPWPEIYTVAQFWRQA